MEPDEAGIGEREKARLEQQYRRQEALSSIELAINEPDELSKVLDRIISVAADLLPACGGACILLWDAESQTCCLSASSAPMQHTERPQISQPDEGTRWIIEHKQPLIVHNVAESNVAAHPLLRNLGIHAYVGVPILSGTLCLGVLYALEKEQRAYSDNDIVFLKTLATRAGAAINKVQLYEKLRAANELLHKQASDLTVRNTDLNSFAHTVAHDLKNPLTSIIGFTELLLDEYPLFSDAERLEFLGYIAKRSAKMRQIVDELLLMSQLHNRDVALAPVNMRAVVAEACSRVQGTQDERRAILHVSANWPVALGHAPWLEEVWTNYLSNAIKYGGEPPEVWLGATEMEDGTIRFWVRDNGAGLSAEEQKRLFLPFTRLHGDEQEGHGLGLSIVRRIVEKCGGRVGVESRPGKGSMFWFTLPTAEK